MWQHHDPVTVLIHNSTKQPAMIRPTNSGDRSTVLTGQAWLWSCGWHHPQRKSLCYGWAAHACIQSQHYRVQFMCEFPRQDTRCVYVITLKHPDCCMQMSCRVLSTLSLMVRLQMSPWHRWSMVLVLPSALAAVHCSAN
jgi:hypothetical protein